MPRQQKLVNAGFSRTLNSKHLFQGDGFSHAIDIVAVGDLNKDGCIDAQDKSLTWAEDIYTEIAGGIKKASRELRIKIRWGGDFKSFFDGPHFEVVYA